MNKKTLIIVIAVVLAFIAVWAVLFTAISNRVEYGQYKGFVNLAWEIIQEDEYFEDTYGSPKSFEYLEKSQLSQTDEGNIRVGFIVITESGEKYHLTVDILINDECSYVEIRKV